MRGAASPLRRPARLAGRGRRAGPAPGEAKGGTVDEVATKPARLNAAWLCRRRIRTTSGWRASPSTRGSRRGRRSSQRRRTSPSRRVGDGWKGGRRPSAVFPRRGCGGQACHKSVRNTVRPAQPLTDKEEAQIKRDIAAFLQPVPAPASPSRPRVPACVVPGRAARVRSGTPLRALFVSQGETVLKGLKRLGGNKGAPGQKGAGRGGKQQGRGQVRAVDNRRPRARNFRLRQVRAPAEPMSLARCGTEAGAPGRSRAQRSLREAHG